MICRCYTSRPCASTLQCLSFAFFSFFSFSFSESSDLEDEQLLSRRAIDMVLDSCEEVAKRSRQAFLRVVVGREHPADVARDLGMTANAIYVAKIPYSPEGFDTS